MRAARDLVVLASVNFGAEVIADGHIHVYAPLRGRAIAGARGNTEARIFAPAWSRSSSPIAGIYRTTESALPADVLRQAGAGPARRRDARRSSRSS